MWDYSWTRVRLPSAPLLKKASLCSTMCYARRLFMSFSIRLTEEERKLADSYAKLHSLSISEAFKRALFEKIEDEFDIVLADKAYDEYKNNPETYSLEELEKELGL